MELIPRGVDEKFYFEYGDLSLLCVSILKRIDSRMYVGLYDEYKQEHCEIAFITSSSCNHVTVIKRVEHVTMYKKEIGRNLKEVYQEITDCLINYLPDYILDNFKQYCEKLLTKEPVGGAKRKDDFKWN